MPVFEWDSLKSKRLKKTRGASFKEVLKGEPIDMIDHPNRPEQKILLIWYRNYVWAVPCVVREDAVFFKTLYRCRKYTKMFKKGKWS